MPELIHLTYFQCGKFLSSENAQVLTQALDEHFCKNHDSVSNYQQAECGE